MSALGHTICRMLALTCDLSEHHFKPYFKKPLAVLRLLHYTPDRSAPDQGKFAAGAHSDYGMITLLANVRL
jgi:isopenicillin N synthase-like dioxygenase